MQIQSIECNFEELEGGARGFVCRIGDGSDVQNACAVTWPEGERKTPTQVANILRAFAAAIERIAPAAAA